MILSKLLCKHARGACTTGTHRAAMFQVTDKDKSSAIKQRGCTGSFENFESRYFMWRCGPLYRRPRPRHSHPKFARFWAGKVFMAEQLSTNRVRVQQGLS